MTIQRDYGYRERYVYPGDVGQRIHDERASHKGRGLKIGHDHKLACHIEDKIKNEKWSPDTVIGKIKEQCLVFKTSICTKTVYNYIDAGFFKDVSNKDLWVKKDGKKRNYKKIRTVALNNKNGKSISERPKEADERIEQGNWEIRPGGWQAGHEAGDLDACRPQDAEVSLRSCQNKTRKEVIAVIRKARKRVGGNFAKVFKTITADNGSEVLDSEAIKKAAKCGEVYYAHPYCSRERGSNENGNRILRRFVPKGTDIGKLTISELQRIEDRVNNHPRKIFGYKSANDMAA